MRGLSIVAAGLALSAPAAGFAATRTVEQRLTAAGPAAAASATGDQRLYGHITSVTRRAGHYELRFDPAWFLSGLTANAAWAHDQGVSCRPSACPAVPNDSYVVDESHRTFVYLVPASVRGAVLVHGPTGFVSKRVTVAELAKIVAGTSPVKLYEPLATGVWILVHVDSVRSFAQQYVP